MPIYDMPVDHAADMKLLGAQAERIECGAVITDDLPRVERTPAQWIDRAVREFKDGRLTTEGLRQTACNSIMRTATAAEFVACGVAIAESGLELT